MFLKECKTRFKKKERKEKGSTIFMDKQISRTVFILIIVLERERERERGDSLDRNLDPVSDRYDSNLEKL